MLVGITYVISSNLWISIKADIEVLWNTHQLSTHNQSTAQCSHDHF